MKDVNLETITDTQSLKKIWPPNWFNLIRAKPNLLNKQKGVYKSFSSGQSSLKSFTLTIPWSLAKPLKISPGIIVHLRLTVPRQMVLLTEPYAEQKKELLLCCCNRAWMKNGGLILRSVTVICKMFKTSHRTGKHLMNGDLENHSKDTLFLSDRWLSIILYLRKTS